MKFVEDIVSTRERLRKLGFQVSVPDDTDYVLAHPDVPDDLQADLQHCLQTDQLRKGFDLIVAADAALVLNHPKNGIDGYIGTSFLMELAIAHHFRKAIFTLNPIPSFEQHRWAHEVAMLQPLSLEGEVDRLEFGLCIWHNRTDFDFTLSAGEPQFRKLLHWAWQAVGYQPPLLAVPDMATSTSTTEGLHNRLRDRDRCLERGFQEFGSEDAILEDSNGVHITKGYVRLVCGDHGPYAEVAHSQICWDSFTQHLVKGPGRHYHEHFNPNGIKIYEQFKTVKDEPNPPEGPWACPNNRPDGYAPYRIGYFYIAADSLRPR